MSYKIVWKSGTHLTVRAGESYFTLMINTLSYKVLLQNSGEVTQIISISTGDCLLLVSGGHVTVFTSLTPSAWRHLPSVSCHYTQQWQEIMKLLRTQLFKCATVEIVDISNGQFTTGLCSNVRLMSMLYLWNEPTNGFEEQLSTIETKIFSVSTWSWWQAAEFKRLMGRIVLLQTLHRTYYI